MTPLERAARAIWDVSGRPMKAQEMAPSRAVPESERDWERFLPQAQAVLQAIREPSEPMVEAGAEIVRNVHAEESSEAFASDAANTWRFMIDAALSGH